MTSKKILIVDDDAFDSSLIERALRKLSPPCDIVILDDSRLAVVTFATLAPDLTLLDINMPHVDGFQVLLQIIEQARMNKKAIVMLSGSTNPLDKERALEIGASDYRVKPSLLAEYDSLAEELIRLHT